MKRINIMPCIHFCLISELIFLLNVGEGSYKIILFLRIGRLITNRLTLISCTGSYADQAETLYLTAFYCSIHFYLMYKVELNSSMLFNSSSRAVDCRALPCFNVIQSRNYQATTNHVIMKMI